MKLFWDIHDVSLNTLERHREVHGYVHRMSMGVFTGILWYVLVNVYVMYAGICWYVMAYDEVLRYEGFGYGMVRVHGSN